MNDTSPPPPPPFETDENGDILYRVTTNANGEKIQRSVPWASEKVVATIRTITDTALLAFSRGKDALCSWLAIRDVFDVVVPFYLYMTPDLMSFEEESLDYYEDFFDTEILRIPHPWLWAFLRDAALQPPNRLASLRAADLQMASQDALEAMIIDLTGVNPAAFTAKGIRAADSPNRWANCYNVKQGPVNWGRVSFYPMWDWSMDRICHELDNAVGANGVKGLKLPKDYLWFGRTFDGLDYRFVEPLRIHCPDDYEKLRDWFPFLDFDKARRELAEIRRNK